MASGRCGCRSEFRRSGSRRVSASGYSANLPRLSAVPALRHSAGGGFRGRDRVRRLHRAAARLRPRPLGRALRHGARAGAAFFTRRVAGQQALAAQRQHPQPSPCGTQAAARGAPGPPPCGGKGDCANQSARRGHVLDRRGRPSRRSPSTRCRSPTRRCRAPASASRRPSTSRTKRSPKCSKRNVLAVAAGRCPAASRPRTMRGLL